MDIKKLNSFNPHSDWNVHSEQSTSKVQTINAKNITQSFKSLMVGRIVHKINKKALNLFSKDVISAQT